MTTQDRRLAEHRCVQCGAQDESTLAGHYRCRVCIDKQAAYLRRIHRERKAAGQCQICGMADSRTRRGMMMCARCAMQRSEYYYRRKEDGKEI